MKINTTLFLSTIFSAILLFLRIIRIVDFSVVECFIPMIISFGTLGSVFILTLPILIKAFKTKKNIEEFINFLKSKGEGKE